MADSSSTPLSFTEDVAVKAVNKRYEGLVTVRTKANKGKGAWYWAHFEPILIRNPETTLPQAVKLKCTLCDSAFSASNPSRTASEHLKRGTFPNFTSFFETHFVNTSLATASFVFSASMVVHGHDTTLPISLDELLVHWGDWVGPSSDI